MTTIKRISWDACQIWIFLDPSPGDSDSWVLNWGTLWSVYFKGLWVSLMGRQVQEIWNIWDAVEEFIRCRDFPRPPQIRFNRPRLRPMPDPVQAVLQLRVHSPSISASVLSCVTRTHAAPTGVRDSAGVLGILSLPIATHRQGPCSSHHQTCQHNLSLLFYTVGVRKKLCWFIGLIVWKMIACRFSRRERCSSSTSHSKGKFAMWIQA